MLLGSMSVNVLRKNVGRKHANEGERKQEVKEKLDSLNSHIVDNDIK